MTETDSQRPSVDQRARRGLKIERIFTTEGVHPYDQVTWERRDVVQQNWKTGETVFEQRGVEFPDFWSVNASTIVTTKYFRGAVGTDAREWTLRQLIDRVVKTYRAAGEQHGYFATQADAEVFEHELTHMLLHQVFAFNSPVWFNVGTASPQQVSACQPYDALVSTPAGLVPIGKLVETNAVGAKVYDAHGLTRILAVKANGVKDVLRVHLKSGYMLDVTADHLVWKSSGHGGSGRFVEAGTLKAGDHLEWHRRDSFGEAEIASREVAEAALAGWLQSDGFVGQYTHGTNRSLTIEAMTVTPAELRWVTQALDTVFPDIHRHERTVATQDDSLDCRRTRLYGKALADFVERWGLRARGTDMQVPPQLFTAPLPVVAAYLRSIFQAEGYVASRERSTRLAADLVGERHVRGLQSLLLRFGIFARVRFKRDARPNRKGCWTLSIQSGGDRRLFADTIGFIDPRKADKLERSFDLPGRAAADVKRLEIKGIETIGAMEVYDIQTESGEYLSGSLRVHNCFILSVDDSMDSILNWYREEGFIFKGGSGAGLNLSRIRSSKELLSSGGTASGPVSFMRGADASAGTIKSGGATRRAAKMVVLDVDHPDIEEFVETKAREEDKIRALRDAGFDMDLGGKDIVSVQYQNANNSVRVSDDFMRAVERGEEFGLRARKTGEVIETVDARELFEKIAKAAWLCADPGIQYDDTINDWHTNPETGRITASNPCSEFMSLDNSSCNLASLNLLKFLRDDDTFDAALFVRCIEMIITAMDISICFADFPTEKITQVTRDYRQLGIGYANLGALLMAMGLGYDSDGGRALAAAITSLMTGTSYKRSAELAGVVGPYAGYARNADAHKRVMRKHAAANDAVRSVSESDRDVQKLATKAWETVLKLGDQYGYRNSQASVLAPTGTIGFMMDCDTTGIEPDFSLVKFKKLVGGGSMQIVNQTIPRALRKLGYTQETIEAIVEYIAEHGHVIEAPGLKKEHYDVFDTAMGERAIAPMGHVQMMAATQPFLSGAISKCVVGETLLTTADGLVRIAGLHRGESADTFRDEILEVASPGGPVKTDAFYYGGLRPVREVKLRSGLRVTGTFNHRVLTAGPQGLEWMSLSDLRPGAFVAQQYGSNMWAEVPPSFHDFTPLPAHGSQKAINLPKEMTEELAFLLGAYAAEGHTTAGTWTIAITNSVDSVLERVREAWSNIFGVTARIEHREGKCPQVIASSKTVVEFFDYLGIGRRASNKRIPDALLRSPREMVLAFLQGLALDAYCTTGAQVKWAICLDSPRLLDDLQAVLTNLGVLHGRITKHDAAYNKDFEEVYASGEQALRMLDLVPFLEPDKATRAASLEERTFNNNNSWDVCPFISGRQLYDAIPKSKSGRYGKSHRKQFTYLLDPRTKYPTMQSLAKVALIPGVRLPKVAYDVLLDAMHFSPVVSVTDMGEREVFDISVPGTHAFVGNGLVNHNTVNLPESATVEEIEDVYTQGWKLGLKALAVYRDNCKVGQPLSDAKAKGVDAAEAPGEVVKVVERPVRKRLPKSRPSRTTSFTVGGAEGYMTAGSYPDDGLGEVFLKLGKQGSTLAGVMDAFSMAISISLQYGVPLETYVSKFTNMKFEPAGLTDDLDVRMSQSIMDYIFRRLALDYLPFDNRAALGIYTAEERQRQLDTGSYEAVETADISEVESLRAGTDAASSSPGAPQTTTTASATRAEVSADASIGIDVSADEAKVLEETAKPVPGGARTSAELLEVLSGREVDSPLCLTCGTKMRPAGSCYVCEGCGSTSGCS